MLNHMLLVGADEGAIATMVAGSVSSALTLIGYHTGTAIYSLELGSMTPALVVDDRTVGALLVQPGVSTYWDILLALSSKTDFGATKALITVNGTPHVLTGDGSTFFAYRNGTFQFSGGSSYTISVRFI